MKSIAATRAFPIVAAMGLLIAGNSTLAADPVIIASAETVPNLKQPQLAVTAFGDIFVAFGAGEKIFVCKSVDGGQAYGSPKRVDRVPKLALGMRRGPRLVATDDFVVITGISHESGNVLAWRSLDGGETWSKPVTINDVSNSAREGLHDLAIGSEGLLFCTWLDLRNGQTQIYGTRSKDNGKTWSPNVRVYQSPSGTVCECCHPTVVIDHQARVHVMWRNVVDGNRDMYLAISDDGGQNFGPAKKLGVGSWQLNACPMDGGDMAVAPNGDLLTVWRRDRSVYSARADLAKEELLGQGEQPSLVSIGGESYVCWLDSRGGNLRLLQEASTEPITIASNASDPVLAAPASGAGPVVVVWESKVGNAISIRSLILGDSSTADSAGPR